MGPVLNSLVSRVEEAGPGYVPAPVPVVGEVISMIVSLATVAALSICLTRRLQTICSWKNLQLTGWLIVAIYLDSFIFVFLTGVLAKGVGINTSPAICQGAILLCLVCYMTTKVLIYFFLVEKAYIVRGGRQSRMKDKLYLFNFIGVICPYLVVIVLNFVFRIGYIDTSGTCIIGMKKIAMIPLISFDVLINVYMTLLFVLPLRKLYSYRHNTNTTLRTVALRTFIGSCATLTSSVTNLTVIMVLEGEPGWICLMCCNADILFSVLVLHWVTSIDTNRAHTPNDTNHSHPIILTFQKDDATKSRDREHTGSPFANELQGEGSSPAWIGKTKSNRTPTVTTKIVACDSDVERAANNIALDAITVRTEQVRVVEVDGRSDTSAKTGASGSMDYQGFQRHGSTDQIVEDSKH